jgi:hypothetical protein
MEAIQQPTGARKLIQLAYARPLARQKLGKPYHLGIGFDLTVAAVLLIVAVGFLTA